MIFLPRIYVRKRTQGLHLEFKWRYCLCIICIGVSYVERITQFETPSYKKQSPLEELICSTKKIKFKCHGRDVRVNNFSTTIRKDINLVKIGRRRQRKNELTVRLFIKIHPLASNRYIWRKLPSDHTTSLDHDNIATYDVSLLITKSIKNSSEKFMRNISQCIIGKFSAWLRNKNDFAIKRYLKSEQTSDESVFLKISFQSLKRARHLVIYDCFLNKNPIHVMEDEV